MIGIKAEVVQCAKANRVSVLILPKGFGVPSDRSSVLSDSPWHAAIPLVVKRAVVCPSGLLWRRVKADVTEIGSST